MICCHGDFLFSLFVKLFEQSLAQPHAAEEEASEEEEEDEEDDEEEDDDITSAESDDSEDEADVQLPRMQRQSKRGQNWDKTTISY